MRADCKAPFACFDHHGVARAHAHARQFYYLLERRILIGAKRSLWWWHRSAVLHLAEELGVCLVLPTWARERLVCATDLRFDRDHLTAGPSAPCIHAVSITRKYEGVRVAARATSPGVPSQLAVNLAEPAELRDTNQEA